MLRRPPESAQYASGPYRAVLERGGIQQSMSRRGNCLDNAPMESFFASLKTERVHEAQFRTRAEARAAVFESIEVFYNRQRLHSALGYRTPAEARASMEALTMRVAAGYSDLIPPLSGCCWRIRRDAGDGRRPGHRGGNALC
jgi:integrase-like protein